MKVTLRAIENESRNIVRAHGLIIAFYMLVLAIGFLREKPLAGTKPLYEVLDDIASPLVWGLALASISGVRITGIVWALAMKENPRPNSFSAVMTWISFVTWAFMALVYYVIAEGGSSLIVLAALDGSTQIYASRMTGTAAGRREIGRIIGD
ncbi:MAG: hypothetical protein JO051_06395 [Acidobacteriaceae bacterium]|nr:hypothetical protein [Acidobacteriaceae bacterium]